MENLQEKEKAAKKRQAAAKQELKKSDAEKKRLEELQDEQAETRYKEFAARVELADIAKAKADKVATAYNKIQKSSGTIFATIKMKDENGETASVEANLTKDAVDGGRTKVSDLTPSIVNNIYSAALAPALRQLELLQNENPSFMKRYRDEEAAEAAA